MLSCQALFELFYLLSFDRPLVICFKILKFMYYAVFEHQGVAAKSAAGITYRPPFAADGTRRATVAGFGSAPAIKACGCRSHHSACNTVTSCVPRAYSYRRSCWGEAPKLYSEHDQFTPEMLMACPKCTNSDNHFLRH